MSGKNTEQVGIPPFSSKRSVTSIADFAEIPTKQIHLVYGSRLRSDLLYYEEMKQLETEFPEFHFHTTLSRESPENWPGPIGYVHHLYENICDHGKKDMDFGMQTKLFPLSSINRRLNTLFTPTFNCNSISDSLLMFISC